VYGVHKTEISVNHSERDYSVILILLRLSFPFNPITLYNDIHT